MGSIMTKPEVAIVTLLTLPGKRPGISGSRAQPAPVLPPPDYCPFFRPIYPV
ncbi:unnamed protein product [Echinostoma caproni]|uniref:Uncharacterized protein n=1 Tax=Echinostoma caproni TaxID=27848 RepID=A0A3P8J7C4_9TREM|nr:unnamed protein product [Echinostoma caproni]